MRRYTSLLAVLLLSCKDSSGPATLVVARVVVTPNAATVPVGESAALQAEAQTNDGRAVAGRSVAWSTATPQLISVTNDGQVTGVAVGSATVTATIDGKSGSATVTVTPALVNTVSVELPATLDPGDTVQATATLRDRAGNALTGRTVTWTTSNTAIAQITQAGWVTALTAGTVTITAQSEGKTGSASLQVLVAVAAMTITPSSVRDIRIGQTVQLTAVPRDGSGNPIARTVAWFTSDSAVATVSATGLVTTVGQIGGTAFIIASAGGKAASVRVRTFGWDVQILAGGALRGIASLRAEDAQALVPTQTEWPATPGLPVLAVACGDGNLVTVQVYAPRLVTASGDVTYWFNSDAAQAATWDEGSGSSSLLHPGPQSETRAFITALKSANTFTLTFTESGTNKQYSPVFRIGGTAASGLAAVLSTIMAECPPTPGPELTTAELAARTARLGRAMAEAIEAKLRT